MKKYSRNGYEYGYSQREKTWMIYTPQGEELRGGDRGQAEFYIDFLAGKVAV